MPALDGKSQYRLAKAEAASRQLKQGAPQSVHRAEQFLMSETTETDHAAQLKKLGEIMSGIKFAMLTTVEPDGALHSRPMTTQEVEFDGDIWFFTNAHSPKVWETDQHKQVNVSFADPNKNKYLSASGIAILVHDREKIEELWKPLYKTFFPKGLDDPDLALLKVSVERAEYWDSASTAIGRAISFAKAYIKKDASELGDHAKVALK
jgi:general stress protein 26